MTLSYPGLGTDILRSEKWTVDSESTAVDADFGSEYDLVDRLGEASAVSFLRAGFGESVNEFGEEVTRIRERS